MLHIYAFYINLIKTSLLNESLIIVLDSNLCISKGVKMTGMKSILFYFKNMKKYMLFIAISLFCFALFECAFLFSPYFKTIMSIASYLTWHNIFEFFAVLVSFAIFVVQYYTYDQTKRVRALFLAYVFLVTGIIEAMHTLSFKGMPEFFVDNTGANRATTFWIILSLISSLGLLIGLMIPTQKKANYNKKIFLFISLTICFVIFAVVTYYPKFLPPMYIEGIGLAPAKIYLERVIALLFTITGIKLIFDYRKTYDYLTKLFICAIIFRMFGGYAFIRYVKVDDIYNFSDRLIATAKNYLN